MRRRTKRDLGIFAGIVLVLGGLTFANMTINRGSLASEMDALRRQVEAQRLSEGDELLSWSLIRETKGSPRRGGVYDPELLKYDGEIVNLIGFMVPQEQFRDVTEFLLLPLPIECYFCQMPPAKDVVLVQLKEGETADIYKEPIIINGNWTIHEGPDNKFLYSIQEGALGAGEMGGSLSRRKLKLQHMLPKHEQDPKDLLEPYAGPDLDSD